MLSDEEKKAIENLKTEYEKLIKEGNILFPLYKSNAKRLINLIEKQSKEIEELQEVSISVKAVNQIDKLQKELKDKELYGEDTAYWNGRVDEKKKWEDKIKAKIEKLDEEIKVKREIAKNPMDRVSGRLLTDSIVELEKTKKVLQSFLEKE